QVPTEVPPARLLCFTFVPIVKRLPTKTHINHTEDRKAPSNKPNKVYVTFAITCTRCNWNQLQEQSEQKMTEDGFFKAEVVYIGDFDECEDAGLEPKQSVDEHSTQEEMQAQFKMPADHIIQSLPTVPPDFRHTKTCFINMKPLPKLPSLETISDSQSSAAPPCCQFVPCLEGSSASISNTVCGAGKRITQEVPSSENGSPSLTSSKESVLFKDWGRPECYSSTQQLFASERSLASPCPSVGSGVFSPAVMRVSCHSLAPGSSLAQVTPSYFSSSDSLIPSPRPLSPMTRHRPPPTRLSLLTAILRKGRLPLLSPSLKRPYSPCWPISPASLSSCHACSVASSLTSIASTLQGSSLPQSPSPVERLSKSHLPALEAVRSTCPIPSSDPTGLTCLPNEQSVSPASHLHLNKNIIEMNHRVTSPKSPRLPASSLDCSDPVESTSSGLKALPPSQTLYPSISSLSSPSPKSTSLGEVDSESFSLLRVTQLQEDDKVQNGGKGSLVEAYQPFRPTPPPRSSSLSPSLGLSPFAPRCSSPRPSSRLSVPDCLTPHPCSSSSPALFNRTPSPSLSVCSTASVSSEGSANWGVKKRKPYKIKSSYKALAAIPTNTLLLDQQAIDESVETGACSQNSRDENCVQGTHSEMCSPAKLRQQSEELYAAIDEVLENPMPMASCPKGSKVTGYGKMTPKGGRHEGYPTITFIFTIVDKMLQTKPGVIRPVTVVPKLQIGEVAEDFHPNPFRQYIEELSENTEKHKPQCSTMIIHEGKPHHSMEVSSRQSEQKVKANSCKGSPGSPTPGLQKTQPKGWAATELPVKETKTDNSDAHLAKDEPSKHTPTTLCAAQMDSELRETHI
ncbi:muscular LMNA-interacting protein isoform X5, partial [Arapaima gigas]